MNHGPTDTAALVNWTAVETSSMEGARRAPSSRPRARSGQARIESMAHGIRCSVPHPAGRSVPALRGVDGGPGPSHESLRGAGLGRGGPVVPHPDAMDLDLVLRAFRRPCGLRTGLPQRGRTGGPRRLGLDLPDHFLVAVRDVAH